MADWLEQLTETASFTAKGNIDFLVQVMSSSLLGTLDKQACALAAAISANNQQLANDIMTNGPLVGTYEVDAAKSCAALMGLTNVYYPFTTMIKSVITVAEIECDSLCTIVTLGTTDFTQIGASANTIGTSFVAGKITAATELVSGNTYKILSLGDTDFTTVGAMSNDVGVVFVATGATTGTGIATCFRTIGTGTVATNSTALENLTPGLPTLEDSYWTTTATTGGNVTRTQYGMYSLAASIVGQCPSCVSEYYNYLITEGMSLAQIQLIGQIASAISSINKCTY